MEERETPANSARIVQHRGESLLLLFWMCVDVSTFCWWKDSTQNRQRARNLNERLSTATSLIDN